MGKITDYPAATKLSEDDVLLKDGFGGTKNITARNAAESFVSLMSVVNHRNTFRGKNLGSAVTTEQKAAISSGTFDDLFLGDYWEISGVKWRIVDMDYWLNTGYGSNKVTRHHLVIMPDTCLYTNNMNDDMVTTGGYVGSKMRVSGLNQAKTTINNAFGSDFVLSHKEYLVNAVTDGVPSGATEVNSTVELPSEVMMYGTNFYSPINNGVTLPAIYTYCKTQLALFRIAPEFITNGDYYWLRDVASSECFACVGSYGGADCDYAYDESGVRPVFSIG